MSPRAAQLAAAAAAVLLAHVVQVECRSGGRACAAPARTAAGWVCGQLRAAADGAPYASFRGVPYAKQPLGELRFKELQPPAPWDYMYDATNEGPVCPQTDALYGRLMQPQGMSEECIHANVHVPIDFLPRANQGRLTRQLQSPYETALGDLEEQQQNRTGAPILVFIHGGGFAFGSGDADLHGPEYLVTKGVIVITFNYRLGPFGFLSLNSSSVPGNAGLRDMVTLLRWVRQNARNFGGDPDRVTLAGQSAGAAAAHLLSLSPATRGLFSRVIIMSGTGMHSFYTTAPGFAQYVAAQFLDLLGINSTDPTYIHRRLVQMPLGKIMEANALLLNEIGLTTFVPVVEFPHAGITTILDDEPETLIAKGRGADIPYIVGFTNNEAQTFRPRFVDLDILDRVKKNALLVLAPSLLYKNSIEKNIALAGEVQKRYFNGSLNLAGYVKLCTETYFQYPALKLAQLRASAPTYVYQFSFGGARGVLRRALGLAYAGAAHIDDLTYLFRVNSFLPWRLSFPPACPDDHMVDWMTTLITNFMTCSAPTCNGSWGAQWPPAREALLVQHIEFPDQFQLHALTHDQRGMMAFFDHLDTA